MAITTTAAVIGGAILGGAALSSRAAGKASDAQSRSAGIATDEQARQFDISREDLAPYRAAGVNALSDLTSRMGPNGELVRRFTLDDFEADPVNQLGFHFGLDEGTKAVRRMFGARGMSRSGSAAKALTRFATDYTGTKAGESYSRFTADQGNLFNRLAAVSGIGQAATTTTANLGANAATNIGNIAIGAGNARGAAEIARGNAFSNALSQGANIANQRYLLDTYFAKPGGDPYTGLSSDAYWMGN